MSATAVVNFLIIGIVAGFLAGQVIHGQGYGIVGNMIIGVIGALLGGYVIGVLPVPNQVRMLGAILGATLGSVIFLFFFRVMQRVRPE